MKTFKYIMTHVEAIIMIFCFIIGAGAAESSSFLLAVALIFGPFAWGYVTNFEKRIEFCEAYERLERIKHVSK